MKRSIQWLAAAVAALVLVEGGSWVVVAKLRPEGVLDRAAPEVLAPAGGDFAAVGDPTQPRWMQGEGIHPYIGFLRRSVRRGLSETSWSLSQPELHQPGSPLFSTDPNDLVVAIAGGSMADQFARLGGGETLGPLLAKQPAYEGRRPIFVSLAGGGVKQPQQIMALQYVLVLGGRIDMVINLDGFNEVALHEGANEPAGVAPIYPRSWMLRVGALESAEIRGERAFLRKQRADLARSLLASPLRFSRARQLLWVIADRDLRYRLADVENRLRGFRSDETLDFVTKGPRQEGSTVESRREALVGYWKEGSLQMDRLCEANGIEYFHFLQPNQYLEGTKPLSEEEIAVAIRTDGLGLGPRAPAGYVLLFEAGESLVAEGVKYHDLTDVFADHPETLYVDDCCHVNRLGNAIMAREIDRVIGSW